MCGRPSRYLSAEDRDFEAHVIGGTPFMAYADYLKSSHWKKRRQEIFERANGLCERCSAAPPMQVHHRSYAHLGQELDHELMAVCIPCPIQLERDAGGYWGGRKLADESEPKNPKRRRQWLAAKRQRQRHQEKMEAEGKL